MRYIFFFLPLIYVINTNCFAQKKQQSIFIGQAAVGGIRNYSNIIATNNDDIAETMKRLRIDGLFLEKCTVNDKTFKFLQDFFSKNCNTKNKENAIMYNFILIRINAKRGEQICYLVNKEQINLYFEKLIQKVEKMSVRNENKELLEMFNAILRIANYVPKE